MCGVRPSRIHAAGTTANRNAQRDIPHRGNTTSPRSSFDSPNRSPRNSTRNRTHSRVPASKVPQRSRLHPRSASIPRPTKNQAGRQKNGITNVRQDLMSQPAGCQPAGQNVGREIRSSPMSPGMLRALIESDRLIPIPRMENQRKRSLGTDMLNCPAWRWTTLAPWAISNSRK